MAKRTVISVSVSPRNENAMIVADALAERGISLTHGGSLILEWAAAFLVAPPPTPVSQEPKDDEIFGMSLEELDSAFDAF